MSDVKVSDLPAATSLATTDYVVVNNSGVTKRATFDLLPVLQAGSSAGTRTLQGKAREIVAITDYENTGGALVAASVADNATGLTAAMAAAVTAGTALYVPGETFGHSGFTHSAGVEIYGHRNSTLSYTGASVGITTPTTGSNFILNGVRLLTTTGTVNYRMQGTCADLRMFDAVLAGGSTACLLLQDTANNIKLSHSTFTSGGDNAVAASGGILSTGNANGVGIVGCNINSNDGWGIAVTNICRGWSITGGTVVEGNTLGGMHGTGITGLSINGTYWENTSASTYQISLENLGATLNLGVDIRGNIFSCAATFDCLALQYITGLTVESNEFRATRYAIDMSGGNVTNYRIANNQVLAGANLFYDGTDISDAQVITDVGQTHRAGTGDGTFTPAGRFARSSTAVGTDADTAEKVLGSIPYPANTLTANGQAIRVTAWGTFAANGNTKTLRMRANGLGSSAVSSASGAYNGVNWRIDCVFQRTGAATQDNSVMTYVGTTIAANDTVLGHTVALNGDATLVITGQNGTGTANDIVCEGFIAEYIP